MLSNGLRRAGSSNWPPGLGFQPLFSFFSRRVLRGGPRLLLQLAACLALLVLITLALPHHMSRAVFGSTVTSAWPWRHTEEETVVGGLRIVVFGESDFTVPERREGDGNSGDLTWTEALCQQLNCTSHLSFVPSNGRTRPSLSSNWLHAKALERISHLYNDTDGPGLNYSYVGEDYPTPWEIPDLSTQVATFLSLPKPQSVPKETLWVLNFGLWDIWSLAAIPRVVSEPVVTMMILNIFSHISKLYSASIDPESVAHSDFYGYLERAISENATSRDQADTIKQSHMDSFRILVPTLLDPTLLPAWSTSRPVPNNVHSKAEQMRIAVELTKVWNDNMQWSIEKWVKNENQEPEKDRPSPPNLLNGRQLGDTTDPAPNAAAAAGTEAPPPEEPTENWPLRDAITYDLPKYLTECMIDRQLRNSGLKDSNGVGAMPVEQGFLDVMRPCIEPVISAAAMAAAARAAANDTSAFEVVPVDLSTATEAFGSTPTPKPAEVEAKPSSESQSFKQTSGSTDDKNSKEKKNDKAGHETVAAPTESVNKSKTTKREKRVLFDIDWSGWRGWTSRDEKDTDAADGETTWLEGTATTNATICEAPHEHLFYTGFTLAQRAIADIAWESAEMVRKNDTIRAKWASRTEALASSAAKKEKANMPAINAKPPPANNIAGGGTAGQRGSGHARRWLWQ